MIILSSTLHLELWPSIFRFLLTWGSSLAHNPRKNDEFRHGYFNMPIDLIIPIIDWEIKIMETFHYIFNSNLHCLVFPLELCTGSTLFPLRRYPCTVSLQVLYSQVIEKFASKVASSGPFSIPQSYFTVTHDNAHKPNLNFDKIYQFLFLIIVCVCGLPVAHLLVVVGLEQWWMQLMIKQFTIVHFQNLCINSTTFTSTSLDLYRVRANEEGHHKNLV